MRRLRVLLVDDEIMIREGFKKLFDWEAHDCEVIGEAGDGMEAMTQIDLNKPDIVIMDINIPILNGLKVIQMSRLKYPDMAFVIVSGYDDFEYCREALRLRITDYILKPVNYEEFGSCIDHLKISLYEKSVAKDSGKEEERVIAGVIRYMQEHLEEEITLNVLAEKFHVSRTYISRLLKKYAGKSFLEYLTDVRFKHVEKLIADNKYKQYEIAEMVGYKDITYFSVTFKKLIGVSPSEYQDRYREET